MDQYESQPVEQCERQVSLKLSDLLSTGFKTTYSTFEALTWFLRDILAPLIARTDKDGALEYLLKLFICDRGMTKNTILLLERNTFNAVLKASALLKCP